MSRLPRVVTYPGQEARVRWLALGLIGSVAVAGCSSNRPSKVVTSTATVEHTTVLTVPPSPYSSETASASPSPSPTEVKPSQAPETGLLSKDQMDNAFAALVATLQTRGDATSGAEQYLRKDNTAKVPHHPTRLQSTEQIRFTWPTEGSDSANYSQFNVRMVGGEDPISPQSLPESIVLTSQLDRGFQDNVKPENPGQSFTLFALRRNAHGGIDLTAPSSGIDLNKPHGNPGPLITFSTNPVAGESYSLTPKRLNDEVMTLMTTLGDLGFDQSQGLTAADAILPSATPTD